MYEREGDVGERKGRGGSKVYWVVSEGKVPRFCLEKGEGARVRDLFHVFVFAVRCVVSCTVRWVHISHPLPFLLLLLLPQPFQRSLHPIKSQYQKYLPEPRKTIDSPTKPPQLLYFHRFVVHTILVFFRNSL